jgi:diaminopropionate ammonia-lyase
MHLVSNSMSAYKAALPPLYESSLGSNAPREVRKYFSAMLDYRPTPLLDLQGLARSVGVAAVYYKDEGHRFGQNSFKALGGSYAVTRLVHKYVNRVCGESSIDDLFRPSTKRIVRSLTVACATDGNHGCSVAWGASILGCACVIFLHEGVSKTREEAITAYGARIVRVPGVYDDSVAEAARVAAECGWHLVSDFASGPFDETTSFVMQGYTLMVDELITELGSSADEITHLFLQGGCGALAAAVSAHFRARVVGRPTIVVVEPDRANCLLQSAQAAALTQIKVTNPTCMTMLECYEPSHMAWPVLERTADFFMDISDELAEKAARRLAAPVDADPLIRAGVSGVAGLAGLLACQADSTARAIVGLNHDARVLLIGSEGFIE